MIPVQYTADNQVVVDAFEALPAKDQVKEYWGHADVEPVRQQIKDHYIAEQNYVCVYCHHQVVTANKALWDAEHVISRATAVRFMFTPENLAISCRDCNIAKGEQEIRTSKPKEFPKTSAHYSIVHPHYDEYGDHIRWFGEICAPISAKGAETLVVCNLTRFTAKLLGIEGKIVDPGFDKYVGELIKAKTKIEAKAALAAVTVYVEDIPQA